MMVRAAALTLAVGLAGAALARALGVPAAALVGSTLAVTLLAALGLQPALPDRLRDAAFTVIGVTLGAGITPNFLADVAKWPVSLAGLTTSVLAIMVVSGYALTRLFRMRITTAILSTSPGALACALALASEGRGDVRAVMVLQSLRLLAITLLLPPVIALLGEQRAVAAHADAAVLSYPAGVVLLASGFLFGTAGARLKVPAAFLLCGLAASGAAHAAGLVAGRLPDALNFLGFTIAGAVIAARFGEITGRELKALGLAAAAVSAIGMAVSAGFSLAVSRLLDLPFGQVWVAFAPGGVEAMASMALSLGYDPVYVATHHVFRMMGLLLLLPAMLRFAERAAQPRSGRLEGGADRRGG